MQRAPTPATPASGSSTLDTPDSPDVLPSSLGALRLSNGGLSKGGLGSLDGPQWNSRDPRTSSTQSLVPSTEDGEGDDRKRKLLVVYIHGFMGNNSSFRSFPAHVHSFLKNLLAETHAIHTKIYPRYKTYKSIDVACENFSNWLAPHESPTTDVVLVGHSMGGLLAADVVLLPNQGPYNAASPFRHRILGTISLDAPLLGLHPGIVVSGIASLFRPAPNPPLGNEDAHAEYARASQSQTLSPDPSLYSEISPPSGTSSPSITQYAPSSTGGSSNPGPRDPYFDPPFPNDVAFVDRGWFKNIIHFATKHKEENLVYAAANHIVSHLEFGACLADYAELKSRYNRLRDLEDVDNWSQPKDARVRFVNYYTVSTGIIKKPRSPSPNGSPRQADTRGASGELSRETDSPAPTPKQSIEESRAQTPKISIEDYSDGSGRDSLQILDPIPEPEPEPAPKPGSEPAPEPELETEHGHGPGSEHDLDPEPRPESETPQPPSQHEEETQETEPTSVDDNPLPDNPANQDPDLPQIPSVPPFPDAPDLEALPDKESRKQAQKTYKTLLKAHAQAVKARDKAVKERQKALEKQERKALKEEKKLAKQQAKLSLKSPRPEDGEEKEKKQKQKEKEKGKKPPRRRKFCMLPSKSGDGARDPAWVEVYMEGVDEVGAHCGLFLPGPHYERLVGDVGEKIAGWVWEEASRKVVLAGEERGVVGLGGGG